MNERYTKVFSSPENVYAPGSPLLISAGVILKDNKTEAVLVQLKLMNLSANDIKAVTVNLVTYDIEGNVLEENIQHQYLDLNVDRDMYFGQKEPIKLNNPNARSFNVSVSKVVFCDNSVVTVDGEKWESLDSLQTLEIFFEDEELAKQYRLKCGSDSNYLPENRKDLWICTCGAINHSNEELCHKCQKNNLSILEALNVQQLREEKNERLKLENEQREERKTAKEKEGKKQKLILMIAVTILVVVSLVSIISTSSHKEKTYTEAIRKLELCISDPAAAKENNYDIYEVFNEFEDFGDYKDSAAYLKYGMVANLFNEEGLAYINQSDIDELSVGVYCDSIKVWYYKYSPCCGKYSSRDTDFELDSNFFLRNGKIYWEYDADSTPGNTPFGFNYSNKSYSFFYSPVELNGTVLEESKVVDSMTMTGKLSFIDDIISFNQGQYVDDEFNSLWIHLYFKKE